MNLLDRSIFEFIHAFSNQSEFIDLFFVFAAKTLPWIIVLWAVYLILRKKDWGDEKVVWKSRFQYLSLGFISVIISRGVIANILNTAIDKPRPFVDLGIKPLISHIESNSFPSGHMSVLIPLVLLLFLVNKKAGWWSLILTTVVGLSRIAAGVHWPVDILGGVIVGLISFIIIKILFEKKKLI